LLREKCQTLEPATESLQTNEGVLKNHFIFCPVILASLTSNISASKQNFKNLLGNLRDIKVMTLIAKFEL